MSELTGARVLVTGADGFIGSHLVERLVEEGADVCAFCIYNSNGSLGWLDELEPKRRESLDIRMGDIRDERFVRDSAAGADVVFHLAALIAIPYSYAAPASFVDTNVRGTLNVLEAVRAHGARRMVNTSTSEVYGTPDVVPIVESHPLKGQSPYSATKIAADKMCEAFALSFDTPVITLRPFNTFGPRQSARAVIPTILGQLMTGATEVRLGNVEPRRDFTYVSDTVDGFIRSATAPLEAGETIQLGSGAAVSVADLFRMCCEVTGSDAVVATDEQRVRPERSEVMVLQSDPSRAKALLGWEPTVSLTEGLRMVAKWLEPRLDPARASRYQR